MRRDGTPPGVERIAAPALRAFDALVALWHLTDNEQAMLLGHVDPVALAEWRGSDLSQVMPDTLARIGHLLGIHRALETLVGGPSEARQWLRGPNTVELFPGRTPFELMLRGGIDGLKTVRSYLEAQFEWG